MYQNYPLALTVEHTHIVCDMYTSSDPKCSLSEENFN